MTDGDDVVFIETILGMVIYKIGKVFLVAEEISDMVVRKFDTLADARRYIKEMPLRYRA